MTSGLQLIRVIEQNLDLKRFSYGTQALFMAAKQNLLKPYVKPDSVWELEVAITTITNIQSRLAQIGSGAIFERINGALAIASSLVAEVVRHERRANKQK